MNHKITQVFVVGGSGASVNVTGAGVAGTGAFPGAGTTDTLKARQLNFYKPDYSVIARAAITSAIGNEIIVAVGTSDTTGSKFGSFKSSVIKKNNLTRVTKTSYNNVTKQQITFIGYDEVTTTKTPSFACDEEYFVTFKIDEYFSKGIYQPLIQESVRVKTTSCTECGGGCDALNCWTFMQELTDRINANPILSKYLSATHSIVGTAPTFRYVLNIPDSGDSTAEAATLTALQAYYPSGTYGTITETNTEDADSLGQIFFIIATPLVAIDAMPLFNGIAWERQAVSAGSVTSCGIKVTGKAVDAFGNACVPDAVPYVFNLVKFQVKAHRGPFNSQDFDIDDVQTPWSITTVQNIQYPIGALGAMAEMERNHFTNNLPAVAEARYYWNPIYNEGPNAFLFVDQARTASGYTMFEICYLDSSLVGFEKKTVNEHAVVLLVDAAVTTLVADVQIFLNNFLSGSTLPQLV
jgi:hypothetical protein